MRQKLIREKHVYLTELNVIEAYKELKHVTDTYSGDEALTESYNRDGAFDRIL